MKISAAFPSTYLKAADLQNQQVTAVIDRVTIEEVGDGHKPVVYFQQQEKGLVLNKTNANNIAMAYGDDTDNWMGGEIILFPAMVDFQGRSVEAIRVKVPPRRPAMTGAQVAANSVYAPQPNISTSPARVEQYNELNPPPPSSVRF